jgi:pyruvate kinase
LIDYAIKAAKELKLCKSDDKIVVILGSDEENPDEGDILNVKIVP